MAAPFSVSFVSEFNVLHTMKRSVNASLPSLVRIFAPSAPLAF